MYAFFGYDQQVSIELEDISPEGEGVIAIFVSFSLLYYQNVYEILHRIK